MNRCTICSTPGTAADPLLRHEEGAPLVCSSLVCSDCHCWYWSMVELAAELAGVYVAGAPASSGCVLIFTCW